MDETDLSAAAAGPEHQPEHPEGPQEKPALRQNLIHRLRHQWEMVLLVAMVGFVAFLTFDLLRPVPRAVIRLEPYHASVGPSAASVVAGSPSGESPSEATTTQTDRADALPEESDSGAAVGALPSADETSGIAGDGHASAEKTPGIARDAEKMKDKHRKKAKKHGHAEKKSKHPALVQLNAATLEQLQQLPGIGPKIARRVLDYRREHGRFSSVEEIMEVKGIGAKKFEKMKPYLKV